MVRVSRLSFTLDAVADVWFSVEVNRTRYTDLSVQLRRHDDSWRITADSLTALLNRSGAHQD